MGKRVQRKPAAAKRAAPLAPRGKANALVGGAEWTAWLDFIERHPSVPPATWVVLKLTSMLCLRVSQVLGIKGAGFCGFHSAPPATPRK